MDSEFQELEETLKGMRPAAPDDACLGRLLAAVEGRLQTPHVSVSGIEGKLAALRPAASILTAADDPVIPVDDFHALKLPASATLEVSPRGGHCGFIENARLDGFAERWIAQRLTDAVSLSRR